LNTRLRVAFATLPSWAALASNMKSRTSAWILAMTVFATLALPLAAQNHQANVNTHHHYQMSDLRTLGGPSSGVETEPEQNVINNKGTIVGGADTSLPTPEINQRGEIAGLSETSEIDPALGTPEFHAVLWDKDKVQELGTLGGTASFAEVLNNHGQVVGNWATRVAVAA
jgi:uncharacterized membrane protein